MLLREAFEYEFSRLDPTADHIDPPHVAVYETLLDKGADFAPVPGLARSWEVSADGLEWRLALREGVRFHSGARCDAGALVRTLEQLRFPLGTEQLWYWDPVDTVTAEDDSTLVFRLRHPYARLPSLLWGTHTAIHNASPDAVADGTGPFRLVSWSPERVVAARFEGYAGPRTGLSGIEWVSLPDGQERLDALERGRVHLIHDPPPAEVDRLAADPRWVVVERCQPSVLYLGLDWSRADLGFDDVRVRQAVSLALDREAIASLAWDGRGRPLGGPIPHSDEHYDPVAGGAPARDLRKARELLHEARGEAPIVCECVVQDDSSFRRIAALVAGQLAELGVRLELRYVKPFAPFYAVCAEGPAAFLSRWHWQDGVDAMIGFASTGGEANWQHAAIPELDEAFAGWLRAADEEALWRAASRVQRIAVERLPYVPIATPSETWVHTARLYGLAPNAGGLYPRYGGVRLDPSTACP
jgi:peptide/nickel transport system substrate-binding protein